MSRRFLLLGGGGFMMRSHDGLDGLPLAICGRTKPKICFVPTACGDSEEQIERFYMRYRALNCRPTHLAFFRKPSAASIPPARLAEAIPDQDVVFVGGGNTRSMLAVWKEWGLPEVLAKACQAGTLLSGMSAGALCWFQWALSDSIHGPGTVTAIPGLGWLPGGCTAHFNRGDRASVLRVQRAAKARSLSSYWALPDGVAVLLDDGQLQRVFSTNPAVGAYVFQDGQLKVLPVTDVI